MDNIRVIDFADGMVYGICATDTLKRMLETRETCAMWCRAGVWRLCRVQDVASHKAAGYLTMVGKWEDA